MTTRPHTHIKTIGPDEASGELAEVYTELIARRGRVPEIYQTMSLRPDVLRRVADLMDVAHFRDGHLTRRQKEMIATYASALNRCAY